MRIAKWEVPSIRNTKPSLLRRAHELGPYDIDRRFSPEGDGGSGRRPLPPDHFTFW